MNMVDFPKNPLMDKDEVNSFISETFKFWFEGNEHIRSPFPLYMRENLVEKSVEKLYGWLSHISEKAKDEVNDEIIAEKFEEIIFDAALELVESDDERITIQYPFLPRLGDKIEVKDVPEDVAESVIFKRVIDKRGDETFLKVELRNLISQKTWETEFELPK